MVKNCVPQCSSDNYFQEQVNQGRERTLVSQSVLTTTKNLSFSFLFFLTLTSTLTFLFLFACASTPSSSKKQTSLVNVSISKDIQKMQGSSIPVDEAETFSSEDEHAVIWLKLQDVSDSHTLRWE